MARTIRVYKASNGDWVAKRDGASKAAGRFATQKDAYLYARGIALNQGLTITVYYPTGGIKAVINPKNRAEEESNCFITTSCVKYFGLKDDCYELETLRNFRDSYLLKSIEGKKLVQEYYSVAPLMVQKLSSHKKKNALYKEVFGQIKIACQAIENENFEEATSVYKNAVSRLFFHLKTV
jgi:hypothetical protein